MPRMAKAGVREHEIQNSILDWLDWQGDFFAWPTRTTGLFDPKTRAFRPLAGHHVQGVSDIIVICRPSGKLCALEVKTPKELDWLEKNFKRLCETHLHEMKTRNGNVNKKDVRFKHQIEFIETVISMGGIGGFVSSIEQTQAVLRKA